MSLDENAAFEPTGSQDNLAPQPEAVITPQPEVGATPQPAEPQAALAPESTPEAQGDATPPADPQPATEPAATSAQLDDATVAAAPSPGDTAARPGASAPRPTVASTARLPHTGTSPEAPEPRLSDVNRDLLRWLKSRTGTVGAYLSAHAKLVGLVALALVAFVLGAVLFGMNAAQVPSDSQIAADARAMLPAPTYNAGDYATSEELTLNLVEVSSKQRSDNGSDACDVHVTATFSNDHIESQANATLTYIRKGDTWTCTAATVNDASHRAVKGVDEQLVLASIDTLLQEANDPDDGRLSLSSLYREANVEVTSDKLSDDKQSENLTLHCTSTGTFVCYECDLTAHFKFAAASGAWELASVQASSGAKDLGFSPLVGTWNGTFRSQEADGGKCLAASKEGLSVTIKSASSSEDGGATIQGTLSGTAHLHAPLNEDAIATDGDLQLDGVPFTGTLQESEFGESSGGIVFNCATQDTVGGSVALVLSFGSSTDPNSATATLVSTHDYEGTFLWIFPQKNEARFADTFTLEKAPA